MTSEQVPSTRAGAALPDGVRAGMERSFGADFAAVRVHEDEHVAAMGARAYARGADVYFAPGRYRPEEAEGRELLGHELAHVVQQAQGRVRPTVQAQGWAINEDEELEREADELGARAARGERVGGAHAVAAPMEGAPVQGYFETADFRSKSGFFGPKSFTVQAPKPTGHRDGKHVWLEREIEHVAPSEVRLRVADDRSMAVQATAREPKEMYAAPEVIAQSNDELGKVGGAVRLQATPSATVTVGGQTLQRAEPVPADRLERTRKPKDDLEFVALCADLCINMASHVIGNRGKEGFDLVLKDGGETYTHPIHPDSLHDETIDRLGGFLGGDPEGVGRGEVEGALDDDRARDPDLPQAYGRRSGSGELDDRTKALGVNRGALPEIGEAYATFSQRSTEPGEAQSDWSSLGEGNAPTQRPETWGYHFAAVVAKSQDGADRVTLENYRRSADMKEAAAPHLAQLLPGRVRHVREGLVRDLDRAPTPAELFEALLVDTHVAEAYVGIHQRAIEPSTLWYFRMYGSSDGQTFHDEQAGTGTYVNPLTVRARQPLEDLRRRKREQLVGGTQYWIARIGGSALEHPQARSILADLAETLGACRDDLDGRLEHAGDHEALLGAIGEIEQDLSAQITVALCSAYTMITGERVATRTEVREGIRGHVGFKLIGSRLDPEDKHALGALAALIDDAPERIC